MATKGYPGAYDKGSAINNSESDDPDCIIFHAGTARDEHGQLIATGGRVLAVTGMGDNAAIARQKAYEAVAKIDWPEGFYRSDIAADS
jgi:phosphoribosylamine--glycine ligase